MEKKGKSPIQPDNLEVLAGIAETLDGLEKEGAKEATAEKRYKESLQFSAKTIEILSIIQQMVAANPTTQAPTAAIDIEPLKAFISTLDEKSHKERDEIKQAIENLSTKLDEPIPSPSAPPLPEAKPLRRILLRRLASVVKWPFRKAWATRLRRHADGYFWGFWIMFVLFTLACVWTIIPISWYRDDIAPMKQQAEFHRVDRAVLRDLAPETYLFLRELDERTSRVGPDSTIRYYRQLRKELNPKKSH